MSISTQEHKPPLTGITGISFSSFRILDVGGGRRDRTDDLMLAKHALSQLSYAPSQHTSKSVVGLGRLELPTSRLSGVRSNQLSYRPSAQLDHAIWPRWQIIFLKKRCEDGESVV